MNIIVSNMLFDFCGIMLAIRPQLWWLISNLKLV